VIFPGMKNGKSAFFRGHEKNKLLLRPSEKRTQETFSGATENWKFFYQQNNKFPFFDMVFERENSRKKWPKLEFFASGTILSKK